MKKKIENKKNNLPVENNGIRISKFIADCGVCSRRKAKEFICQQRVKVNNEVVTDLSRKIYLNDIVTLDDVVLKKEDKTVIALNKPVGVICSVYDKFGRKTVIDLLKNYKNIRLYPVGRLDYNSRGLVILTNDGFLAYKITHPKFGIPKVYDVIINKKISKQDYNKLINGIKIEGKELYPLKVEIISSDKEFLKDVKRIGFIESNLKRENKIFLNFSKIRIKIAEGRKRIIRKVFKALGYKVVDLRRIQIGEFNLDNYPNELKEGHYKVLDREEIEKLLEKKIPLNKPK